MSLPDIRDDTDRGGDNGLQAFHLVRLWDTGLEDAQCIFLAHLPYRERNPQLGVVAPRRTYDVELVMQQLIEEFLYDRLSVATGDADHGDVELLPVVSRQFL